MHSSIRTLAAISCAIVVAASAAGCGSDNKKSGGSSSAEKAAVAKFTTAANKVCKTELPKITSIGSGLTVNSPDAAKDAAFAKIGDAFLAEVKKLKAIDAPDSISSDVTLWLASLTQAATDTKVKGSKLLRAGTPSPFTGSDLKATALGLDDCASGTS